MTLDEARLQQIVARIHAARFASRPAERAAAQEALVGDAADLVVEVTRIRAALDRLSDTIKQAMASTADRPSLSRPVPRVRPTGPHGAASGGGGPPGGAGQGDGR